MNDDSSNADWKKAIEICKNFNELGHQEAIAKVRALKLSDRITNKAISIISRINEEHIVLDNNASSMLKKVQADDFSGFIDKTIDSYKIIELIAKGGMSSVFKAKKVQSEAHKPVALKILSPYVFSDKSIELFNREQLILSQLEHPNIVSFHHSGQTEDGTHYLVMEYVDEAQTITDYCQGNKLTTKQIIQYLHKLTKVFVYAHNNLIIHRDIKPSNILIDNQGILKVIDFGIGQIVSKHEKTPTQVFTKNSASPEQILGQNVSIQTDVFSLGAVLLELLVNDNPLPETNIINYDPQNDVKHINRLLKNSSLDSDLKNIIHTALHIDTAKRYATMESFSQDLNNWLSKRPVTASSDSRYYRAKKFLVRNPLTVTLSFIILTGMITSLFIMQNLTNKARIVADRANKTMDFLAHVLMQTDSFQSNIGDITLKQALDLSSDIPLNKVGGDEQLKKTLHMKLSEIYYNMAIDDSALSQLDQALVIMNNDPNIYALEIIEANLQKGLILFGLGQLNESIQINEKMLGILNTKYPKEQNLKAMGYANLLKTYQQSNSKSQFNAEKALAFQAKLTDMLDGQLISKNNAKLSALDALILVATGQKHYDLAETYLLESLNLLDDMQQQNSVSYYIFKSNLAYNYIWQEKHLKAEKLMLSLIAQIEPTDPDNYFLSRVYENYASLMYQTGKKQQCLDALTQALNISLRNKNPQGIYQSLAKRAMYYSRYNMFQLGLYDQLELMPVLIDQSGTSSPRTLAHLMNLALLLYSTKHVEIGFQVRNKAINLAENNSNISKKTIAEYYTTAGLSNWHAGLVSMALEDLKNALEYSQDNDKTKILEHLIAVYQVNTDYIQALVPKDPGVNGLYKSLLYLIQLKDAQIQPQLEKDVLAQHCKLSEQYNKTKLISIKQLLLETCSILYTRYSLAIPNVITFEDNTIKMAINESDKIPVSQLQTRVNAIIESLNE
ncbi:Serine/threonine protein kinase PrkC, regulator of stationary phase [hydrothermal vent metagenome]|uniref:Serine/threonine protein kinase PrkC, regulator of stationary phase n=1 Tax=hydrothermal vent metagenome TaxID=652676 RepID=A0A3B0W042_9ZZZZ